MKLKEFKKFSAVNLLAYGSLGLLFVIFLGMIFSGASAAANPDVVSNYYFATAWQSIAQAAFLVADFASVFVAFLVVLNFINNFWKIAGGLKEQPTMFGSSSIRGALRNAWNMLWGGVVAVIPGILFFIVLSFVLGDINVLDRGRLVDLALAEWDRALTGGYVFASLGSVHYPAWFLWFVTRSFDAMSGIVIIVALCLAAINRRILGEMVAAFCFGMLILVPLWVAFPALSPQDRFIDNIYHLPVPANIAAAVANYHPDATIAGFLQHVRSEKEDLPNLPTSTMPSAHVMWAVLSGYFLWKARRWLGWIALPILVASTFGTVLLAQHYFIDILTSLILSTLTICVVEFCTRRDEEYRRRRNAEVNAEREAFS